jgi:lipopolysaccharide export system permease protein
MTTIDRYIIKKFLSTFFFAVLIFTMVAMVIDFSERIDDFLEEDVPIREIIWKYYLNFIPQINAMLWPLFTLISVIFFTSRMAQNSEILSILNSGASFRRIMRPYLIASSMLAFIHLMGNHFIIPIGNQIKVAFENKYVSKIDLDSKNDHIHLFLDDHTKVYIKYNSKSDSIAHGFGIEGFNDDGELIDETVADLARWQTETQSWRMENVKIRHFDGLEETFKRFPRLDTVINLQPKDLVRRDNYKTTMTTPNLIQFINKERKKGVGAFISFRVEVHRRSSEPFTIIILTCIGMAIASRKTRGGMGIHLAIGAVIGALFIVLGRFSSTLSTNAGLHPFLGAWLPNIVFIFVVIYLVRNAQQ